jgi:hypothetical protein
MELESYATHVSEVLPLNILLLLEFLGLKTLPGNSCSAY